MFKDIDLPEWHKDAECVKQGISPNVFFPDKNESQHTRDTLEKLCGGCAVNSVCLQEAIDNREWDGWHGGASPREKDRIVALGITAAQYLAGRRAGVYVIGPRGRPNR